MKALVGAFNQEKALVGAFSVIVPLHRLIGYSTKHITFVTPLSRVMGADTGLGETRGVVTIDVFILL